MSNPLMQFMGGGANPMLSNPLGNILRFKQELREFQSSFRGNPQQKVQELLESGQMTREQYDQYRQMAQQILPFLK